MLRSQQCHGWLVWVLLEAIPSEFCPGTVFLTARVLPRGPSAVIPLFTSTHLGDSWFLVGSLFFFLKSCFLDSLYLWLHLRFNLKPRP